MTHEPNYIRKIRWDIVSIHGSITKIHFMVTRGNDDPVEILQKFDNSERYQD